MPTHALARRGRGFVCVVVGEWRLDHQYREPGQYLLTIWLHLGDGTTRLERRSIKIPA